MSKQAVLERIAVALRDVDQSNPEADVALDWQYGQDTGLAQDVLELFVERVEDYKAVVRRLASLEEVDAAVASCLEEAGARSLVVPPGLDASWYFSAEKAGVNVVVDEPPLSKQQLDETAAVLTAAAVAMAQTGTIALDHGPDQGRRILTLLPDVHICVVLASQIVDDVPRGLALLEPALLAGQPLTWISGPSATSDIELSRVEGVHGPRRLYVLVVED